MQGGQGDILKHLDAVRNYIVAIPFLHLLLTSLFLIGYFKEAGAGLYNWLTIGDLFSVSIGEVGPAYISIIVMPAAFIIWSRLNRGAWTDFDAAMAAPEAEREEALLKFRKSKRFYQWLIGLSMLFMISALAFHSYRVGYVSYTLWFIISISIFFFVNNHVHSKIDIPSYWMFITYAVGAIFLYCYFAGLSKAQDEFHLTYAVAAKTKLRCGDAMVLRRVGDRFIALLSDNSRVLIDANCKPIMRIPKS